MRMCVWVLSGRRLGRQQLSEQRLSRAEWARIHGMNDRKCVWGGRSCQR